MLTKLFPVSINTITCTVSDRMTEVFTVSHGAKRTDENQGHIEATGKVLHMCIPRSLKIQKTSFLYQTGENCLNIYRELC